MRIMVLSVLTLCLAAHLRANNVVCGRIVTITCKDDPSQRYACYLPKSYTPKKKYPILYCFAPDGNGRVFVSLFKDVCERLGWIVVGSLNARNGPYEPIIAATKAMWKDTHARFSIKNGRCYSSGFSGGSGMAFNMARMYSEHFAGVIPMAVSTSWVRELKFPYKHIAIYFIIGSQDMVNVVKRHAEALKQNGHKVKVHVFSGGHIPPPKNVAEAAVEWMEKVAPKGGRRLNTDSPLSIKLEKEVAKRLRFITKMLERGRLGSALRAADSILKDEKATDAEKKDAQFIKAEIKKHLKAIFGEVERLLKEGLAYDARRLLLQIRKNCGGTVYGKQAQERIKEIDSDESLKDDIAAGRLFARALAYEKRGKEKLARKYFKMVAEKYPNTAYAKKARQRIE